MSLEQDVRTIRNYVVWSSWGYMIALVITMVVSTIIYLGAR